MADQIRKRALKRLMQDLDEIRASPVSNVSAVPLDEDMFEWHCNFLFEEAVYHLILFFPKNYPYESPSAEFVPLGYQFMGGATDTGRKGVKVCLSIFSDFAKYHTEWADEKSMGWSPGYTVQTVLLNLVSFLAETGSSDNPYAGTVHANNAKLAKGFTCKDCGHTHNKPFPAFEEEVTPSAATNDGFRIVDYISKEVFSGAKPKSDDDLYGYGLVSSGPKHRPSLTSPCEFVKAESFYSMKKSVGKVESVMREQLFCFLPLYINRAHGEGIKNRFEATMKEVAVLLPKCHPQKTPVEEMVLKTIPNLMSATVVEFSKGTQHTSDNHLNGYFALHRLLLWAIQTYPGLQKLIDERLEIFIKDEGKRSKKECPHIGEWLMLLSGSSKYTWQEAATAYLSESWKRNVMWYVKDNAKLGFLDTPQKYRLEATLEATAVSRKILAFQVLFLDIAMPKKMSRDDLIKRYDANNGSPTDGMVKEMKDACQRIREMKTYQDWFKVLKLETPSDDEIHRRLLQAVEFSINTDGYKWTFWKNQGGWGAVLKRYTDGTPNWKGGKGKGVGKKSPEDSAKDGGKGKGKGKRKAEDSDDDDDDEKPTQAKAKGGKKKPKEAPAKKEPAGKGMRVSKRKAAEVEESDDSSEDEEEEIEPVKAKGRGRGRGRGVKKLKEEPAEPTLVGKGRGRGRGRGRRGRK